MYNPLYYKAGFRFILVNSHLIQAGSIKRNITMETCAAGQTCSRVDYFQDKISVGVKSLRTEQSLLQENHFNHPWRALGPWCVGNRRINNIISVFLSFSLSFPQKSISNLDSEKFCFTIINPKHSNYLCFLTSYQICMKTKFASGFERISLLNYRVTTFAASNRLYLNV